MELVYFLQRNNKTYKSHHINKAHGISERCIFSKFIAPAQVAAEYAMKERSKIKTIAISLKSFPPDDSSNK